MPIKSLLYRCQPGQLHIVLILSICYFTVQLVFSQMTHSLTLLLSSYHSLCNIIALTGCIITIKHSKASADNCRNPDNIGRTSHESVGGGGNGDTICVEPHMVEEMPVNSESTVMKRREIKLRNTFGWTRIDILTMLIVCIILAALSFSLLVESLQTLVHIDHQDAMHLPIQVMIVGFAGVILNGFTYLLIGGYTMHQGSFLHVTPSGDVVLDRSLTNNDESVLKPDDRQLSKTKNEQIQQEQQQQQANGAGVGSDGDHHGGGTPRQGAVEMLRDLSSIIFVIVCSIIVYMAKDEEHTAKFIDPILAIFSCVLLVSLSYPYMKESCFILLQTIPDSINMESFESALLTKFPEIVSYHDIHIWQLTAQKSVATVHITFQNPKMYIKIIDDIRNYFHEQGINHVTIQPEFYYDKITPSMECLVQCNTTECIEKVCCQGSRSDLHEIVSIEKKQSIESISEVNNVVVVPDPTASGKI